MSEIPKGYYCPKCDAKMAISLFNGFKEHNLSEAFWQETRDFADSELKKIALLTKRYNPNAQKGRSGIAQVVKEAKLNNPMITKDELLNHLISTGFDFRGRNPKKAIGIAWYRQE